jgi:nucleotide-binding universal stress UspA family protein
MIEKLADAKSRTAEEPAPEATFTSALCALDGKAGGFAALEQALAMLRPGGSATVLLVTSYRQEGERRSPAIPPLRAQEIVNHARELAAGHGVDATIEVEPAAPPAQVVLDWAGDHDLLAIGAPSSSWLGGMLVSGVGDSALASFAPALLTARAAAGTEMGGILIASDGLRGSEVPVELGRGLARTLRVPATLVHALGPLRRNPPAVIAEQGRLLAGEAGGEPLVRRGPSHEVIVRGARESGAGLVVMGSRRLGGIRALGSVSRRVVHEAPCSVLLVPPA